IDFEQDVRVQGGERWPTVMSRANFQKVTGEPDFPEYLRPQLDGDNLPYFCNSRVHYVVRGVHVRLDVLWDFEAAGGGGDTHFAVFRGRRSRVRGRPGQAETQRPAL